MSSPSPKIVRYFVLAVLAVTAVLVALNGLVSFLGLNWRILTRRPEAAIGMMYPAGTVVRWGREGFGTTVYSADGEVATPHDEGMEILVIGDSHTEAFQVDNPDKYVSVAEEQLWRHGKRVNLRNLGLGALSFADDVYRIPGLLQRNPPPKAIVLQLSDLSFDISFDESAVNYFRKNAKGEIELVHRAPDLAAETWRNPWWSYIPVFDYANERWLALRARAKKGKRVKQVPPSAQETVASVTAQAKMLADEVGDIPLLILRTPDWPYVDPPDEHAYTVFHTVRQAGPWPVIDPGPELVDYIARTHHDPRTFANWLPMDGHLTRDGQAIVGRVLADAIERRFFSGASKP